MTERRVGSASNPLYRKNYKRKYRKLKRSRRGKYSRKMSLKARITKVLMRKAETKYYDRALENKQLYHNLGAGVGGLIPLSVTSIGEFFHPWAFIAKGTDRFQRIGDKITPRGMSLKLYLANII